MRSSKDVETKSTNSVSGNSTQSQNASNLGNSKDIQTRSTNFVSGNSTKSSSNSNININEERVENKGSAIPEHLDCSKHRKELSDEGDSNVEKNETYKNKTDTIYDIVVAIDVGTSTTGCAYSTSSMFKENPLGINCEQIWNEHGSVNQEMAKTKTCILFDEKEDFISFGYDAEYMYADFRTNNEHENYRFFHNFKMALYDSKIPLSELMLMDITGKTKISAKTLFSEAIRAVKTKFVAMMEQTNKYDVKTANIRWVFTVPAIWSADAKYFMRDCACQAGINNDHITIALEPEAASIYCNHLRVERSTKDSDGFVDLSPGTKYMVVDIGGGTTDITVHEKQKDGTLKEINKASGNGIGGVSVDEKLLCLVNDTLKHDVLSKVKSDQPNVYLDLYYDTEKAKKTFKRQDNKSTPETVPISINYAVCEEILKSYYNSSLSAISEHPDDEIQIDAKAVKGIFDSTAKSILNVMIDSVNSIPLKEISMIIMVGGFANCEIIQTAVKDCFPGARVIIPDNAGLAILFGAVLFGHNPSVITHRFTRKTYGVCAKELFDCKTHDGGKTFKHNGEVYCKNVFSLIIRQNEQVSPGTKLTKEYWSTKETVSFSFFASSKDSPVFCDDPSCRKIGTLQFKYPHSSPLPGKRSIAVDYMFGDTELFVTAKEKTTNVQVETRIILD